jgi:hypothetical protein
VDVLSGPSFTFAYGFQPSAVGIIKDLINALPGNNSVNTVQHATIEGVVFSVDPTDAPVDWQDSDHVICVYCRFMSVPQLYK